MLLFVLGDEVEVFLNVLELIDPIILKLCSLLVPILYGDDIGRVVLDALLRHRAVHLLHIEEVFRVQR